MGKVLRFLLDSRSQTSGEEMGRMLGCTRAAVGKIIDTLRQQGFVINAKTKTGYQLISEPAELIPARVEARLTEGGLGAPHMHFRHIDSTNLEARRRAEEGLPHGACLSTDHQTAGRGRFNRRWVTPEAAGLLFSLFLRPSMHLSDVFSLTSMMAVAICVAIENLGGPRASIKWPNDIYLEGLKLAGILTEFTSCAESIEYVIVGVGLNTNLQKQELDKLDAPANSLLAATGRRWDRAILLAEILNQASILYYDLAHGNRTRITSMYNERFWLEGKTVEIQEGDLVLKGKALGIAPDGALNLELPDGVITQIRNGDVTVLSINT